jgi:hypothetical protein
VTALLNNWYWIVGAAAVLIAAAAALRNYRVDPGRPVDKPKNLFRDLCWAHDLTRREIALLRSLADHWRLATPALLFVEPARFDRDKLGPGWAPQAARIVELRDRLFLEIDEAVTRA